MEEDQFSEVKTAEAVLTEYSLSTPQDVYNRLMGSRSQEKVMILVCFKDKYIEFELEQTNQFNNASRIAKAFCVAPVLSLSDISEVPKFVGCLVNKMYLTDNGAMIGYDAAVNDSLNQELSLYKRDPGGFAFTKIPAVNQQR